MHCASGGRRRANETITQSGINKRVRTGHRELDSKKTLTEDPHPSVAAEPRPPDNMASSRVAKPFLSGIAKSKRRHVHVTAMMNWGSNRSACSAVHECADPVCGAVCEHNRVKSHRRSKVKTQRPSTGGSHYIYHLSVFAYPRIRQNLTYACT